MLRIFFRLCLACTALSFSPLHAEDAQLAELFNQYKVSGTMVIQPLHGEAYIHNDKRAESRYLPASTFKILNTLIALDEGAVETVETVLKWDGKDRGWSAWNRDHSMASGFPVSCVWCYQELARRVGNTAYLRHLQNVGYGNEKTGEELTTFWLQGELAISPVEQTRFLKRLYLGDLPYRQTHMDALKDIMRIEQGAAYQLYAKTGWATRVTPPHGWFVGWLQKDGQAYFFATLIDTPDKSALPLRKAITLEALRLKGLL